MKVKSESDKWIIDMAVCGRWKMSQRKKEQNGLASN